MYVLHLTIRIKYKIYQFLDGVFLRNHFCIFIMDSVSASHLYKTSNKQWKQLQAPGPQDWKYFTGIHSFGNTLLYHKTALMAIHAAPRKWNGINESAIWNNFGTENGIALHFEIVQISIPVEWIFLSESIVNDAQYICLKSTYKYQCNRNDCITFEKVIDMEIVAISLTL